MENIKVELVEMLNQALRLEHAARIQYLAHAEQISGLNSEAIIERLQELAGDEAKHEEKFRKLIASYLGGVPCMEMAATHPGKDIKSILDINLHDEKTAIDFYKTIYKKVMDNKDKLPYEFETLEHELRHIILDEQEHVTELKTLIG
ncbi:MAG: ferritin-like domain-containing protein [Gammaproteobacteria bacterium]|nr:ferritin-like domain-containing protein [Gammaproteobacteria bacterium]